MTTAIPAAHAIAARIEDAVRRRTPFSFVRLGDGEGCLLRHPVPLVAEDREYFKTHFGGACSYEMILAIRNNLLGAISTADLVGVRDDVLLAVDSAVLLDEGAPTFLEAFKSAVPLRKVEHGIDVYAAKRVFRLLKWFREECTCDDRLCSQWVCYDLATSGFWERLLRGGNAIGLIHCSPDLPEIIRSVCGVDVESILVPDKAVGQVQWASSGGICGDHFPHYFESVCDRLRRPLGGQVFLVGAGLVGKGYLKVIKDNGGIGLDLGALLDAWDGRATRPLVYRDKSAAWQTSATPPSEFAIGRDRHELPKSG